MPLLPLRPRTQSMKPAAAAAAAAGEGQLWARLRHLWLAKMLATTLGISAFFMAYFWVLRHPMFAVSVMPVTALDMALEFHAEALPVYLSLWLYVSLAPALMGSGRDLLSFGLASLALAVLGLGAFMLWPTAVPEFAIDWSAHPSVAFLKRVDVSANACPSLHVAFAVFTAIWLARLLAEMACGRAWHALNWLWCGAILYSTLATRQHVVLDVIAGALLGAAVATVHLRWRARVRRPGAGPLAALDATVASAATTATAASLTSL